MLYFPHLMVKNNYYMAVLGSYTRNVLSSKIEALLKFDLLDNQSKYLIWESKKFPDWLTGEVKWDAYRSKAMFSGPIIGVSAILSFFDYFVVFAPSLTLFVLYFFERGERELTWLGIILIAIYISVCFALVTLMSLGKQAYVGVAPPVINRTVFERKDKPQN